MSEKNVANYTVLYLRFRLRVPPDDLLSKSRAAASSIASQDGLIWKIWLAREDKFEMGGIYLFANRETAEAYLNQPLVQSVFNNPVVVSAQSQLWDVEPSLSALTRAPLHEIFEQNSEPEALTAGGR